VLIDWSQSNPNYNDSPIQLPESVPPQRPKETTLPNEVLVVVAGAPNQPNVIYADGGTGNP
jgi:hypothetical protein